MNLQTDLQQKVYNRVLTAVVFVTVVSVLVPLSLISGDQSSHPEVIVGTWGGQGAELIAQESSVRIEFNCAWGHIEGPLEIQSGGEFSIQGLYAIEPGGPGISGEPEPKGTPAIFFGSVKNSEIQLNVTISKQNRTLGPYVVRESEKSSLEKCL